MSLIMNESNAHCLYSGSLKWIGAHRNVQCFFFLGGRRGTRTPKHFVNLTGESKNCIGIPAKSIPNVLWIFMWFFKFYVAYVGNKYV
jgi:hypothetical protein